MRVEAFGYRLAVAPYGHPVDQDVGDTLRRVSRQSLPAGRKVAQTAERSGSNGLRIEDADIGGPALLDRAPVRQAVDRGRFSRQLVHGSLERHHSPIPYPSAKQVG